jgi:hypothetical protein
MILSKEDKLSRSIPGWEIISTFNNIDSLIAEIMEY